MKTVKLLIYPPEFFSEWSGALPKGMKKIFEYNEVKIEPSPWDGNIELLPEDEPVIIRYSVKMVSLNYGVAELMHLPKCLVFNDYHLFVWRRNRVVPDATEQVMFQQVDTFLNHILGKMPRIPPDL